MDLQYRYAAIRVLSAMQPGVCYYRGVHEPCRVQASTLRTLVDRGLVVWMSSQDYCLTAAGEQVRKQLRRRLPV